LINGFTAEWHTCPTCHGTGKQAATPTITDDVVRSALRDLSNQVEQPMTTQSALNILRDDIATLTAALADRARLARESDLRNFIPDLMLSRQNRLLKDECERLREENERLLDALGHMRAPKARLVAELTDPAFVRVPRAVLEARAGWNIDAHSGLDVVFAARLLHEYGKEASPS
jgi:hypothetical protein